VAPERPRARPAVIFFDCWFTLFTSDFVEILRWLAGQLGVPMDRQFVKTFEQTYMREPFADLREPTLVLLDEYAVDPVMLPGLAEELESRLDDNLAAATPYPDTLAGLAELARRYRLGLITNNTSVHLEMLRRRYDLDRYFDVLVTSCAVGAIKPEPAIFEVALSLAGVEAAAALMVGDSLPDDFQAAQALGIPAVLLDRRGRYPTHPGRIADLAGLIDQLGKIV